MSVEQGSYIPGISDLYLKGRHVIVRGDLDVPTASSEHVRLQAVVNTTKFALEHGAARVAIIGHRGRPGGQRVEKLSTRELAGPLASAIGEDVLFADSLQRLPSGKVVLGENLRFNSGEERSSLEFVQLLLGLGNVYINEAFGTAHRTGASLTGLPDHLPSAAGLQLKREIDVYHEILRRTEEGKKLVILMGGAKTDKLPIIRAFKGKAQILVGGRLPELISPTDEIRDYATIATLTANTQDISASSLKTFQDEVATADTLLWNGPMGHIENGYTHTTDAIIHVLKHNPDIFAVAGGGDIGGYVMTHGYAKHFAHIGTGGGSALQLQSGESLPAVEKLRRL